MKIKIIQSCEYFGSNSKKLIQAVKGILHGNRSFEEWISEIKNCLHDTIEDNICLYSIFDNKFEVLNGTTSDGIKYIRIVSNTIDTYRMFVIMTISFYEPTP